MGLPARKRTHTITVEPFTGSGAHGPVFGAAVPVTGYLERATQLVRASDGTEVVSSSTFYCDLEENLPAESRVTLPGGETTSVLTIAKYDTAGRSRLDHQEVSLA